ncbi:MAG TPA: hypothetical protein VIW64_01825 [Pyrinomonadaceae bacterium]|jgi:hypothetical protein
MFRLTATTLALVICLVSLSCQSYSTGLQQSVARADETSAIGALRAVATAEQVYALSNGDNYASFQQLAQGGYLDARFNSEKPVMKDYVLSMEVGRESEGAFFRCKADPVDVAVKTGRHFYIDQSRLLHINDTQPASASDPVAAP